jgi:hypothetical protein
MNTVLNDFASQNNLKRCSFKIIFGGRSAFLE